MASPIGVKPQSKVGLLGIFLRKPQSRIGLGSDERFYRYAATACGHSLQTLPYILKSPITQIPGQSNHCSVRGVPAAAKAVKVICGDGGDRLQSTKQTST